LLVPIAAAITREHPNDANVVIVTGTTDESRVPIGGKRYRRALSHWYTIRDDRTAAHQLVSLLLPIATIVTGEHPYRTNAAVVATSAHGSRAPVGGKRYRRALFRAA
jgi:hypothetical protein